MFGGIIRISFHVCKPSRDPVCADGIVSLPLLLVALKTFHVVSLKLVSLSLGLYWSHLSLHWFVVTLGIGLYGWPDLARHDWLLDEIHDVVVLTDLDYDITVVAALKHVPEVLWDHKAVLGVWQLYVVIVGLVRIVILRGSLLVYLLCNWLVIDGSWKLTLFSNKSAPLVNPFLADQIVRETFVDNSDPVIVFQLLIQRHLIFNSLFWPVFSQFWELERLWLEEKVLFELHALVFLDHLLVFALLFLRLHQERYKIYPIGLHHLPSLWGLVSSLCLNGVSGH